MDKLVQINILAYNLSNWSIGALTGYFDRKRHQKYLKYYPDLRSKKYLISSSWCTNFFQYLEGRIQILLRHSITKWVYWRINRIYLTGNAINMIYMQTRPNNKHSRLLELSPKIRFDSRYSERQWQWPEYLTGNAKRIFRLEKSIFCKAIVLK